MSSDFQNITQGDGRVLTTTVVPAEIIYFRGFATNGTHFIVKEWNGVEDIYWNAGVAVTVDGIILINPNPPSSPDSLDGGLEVDGNGIMYAAETGIIDVIHQAVGLENSIIGGVLQVTVGGAAAPPAAPTNLVATASVTELQIDLTWDDNATNEAGYKVERSPDGVGSWVEIATLSVGANSYPDTAVDPLTQYFYRVKAFNGAGDSAYSNVDDATTGDIGNFRITGVGDRRVTGNGDRRVVNL